MSQLITIRCHMKKICFCALITSLYAFQTLHSVSSATATVTWTVDPINSLSISGSPAPYTINTAVAGSHPVCGSDNLTTYSITTNAVGQKITAALDTDMPDGVTLNVCLQAPDGATSMGSVELSSSPQNMVTGISNIAQSDLSILYNMNVNAAAVPAGTSSRIITYSIGP